jgi:hypothetical protein
MHARTSALSACLLIAAGTLFGQSKPQPLTSVAMFKVTPDKMPAFMDAMSLFPPALDQLIAAGTIDAYGVDSDILHGQGANVAFWITGADFAAIDAAEKAVQSVMRANPEKMKTAWSVIDFASHRDIIVRSLESNHSKVPAGTLPVTGFSMEKIKPGQENVARTLFLHHQKPVLDKLVADGTIYGYSLDVEAVHTSAPGATWLVVTMPNLGAKDRVRAAFNAAREKMPAGERQAVDKVYDEAFDHSAHRDSLAQALIFKSK